MTAIQVLGAFAVPYLLAWLTALIVQRLSILPLDAPPEMIADNTAGRLNSRQRLALLVYNLPELVFGLTAVLIAILWRPAGLNGTVIRWGLVGMALVRLGISWPVWRDLLASRVVALSGPLRKIQFRQRRALATEDGPVVVLPVERALYDLHESGVAATIYYTPHSKRVVAVVAGEAAPSADVAFSAARQG